MKIHQLADGARFTYEGEDYVKTGPMFATGKNGQRLIPKYAVLTPLGEAALTSAVSTTDGASAKKTMQAFELFYSECKRLVPESELPALELARSRFIKNI